MEKILLVEPDYKNKFPPIGLMKIASYHRWKKDYVEFYKGNKQLRKKGLYYRGNIINGKEYNYDGSLRVEYRNMEVIPPTASTPSTPQ